MQRKKLSRRKEHRASLFRSLSISLIKHISITTTLAKAKAVRPFIEKIFTFCKKNNQHSRRVVESRLQNKEAAKQLFEKLLPTFKNRNGGYIRILKLNNRKGDCSPMAYVELVR